MTRILLVLALLLSLQARAQEQLIVGGVEATPGEFPFMVSLQVSGSHFCGGQLVAPNWVLTAAHCVIGGFQSRVKVVIGAHKLSEGGQEVFSVKRVIRHPNYNSGSQDYDFAMVELDGISKFTPIAMDDGRVPLEGAATTAGWGVTREGGYSVSPVLMKVEVPLVSKEACEASYPGSITDRMVCAGLPEGGKDSCQGDSGGPLLVYDEMVGEMVLVGVVSWGEGCARPGKYGVYSKVSSVIDWIQAR